MKRTLESKSDCHLIYMRGCCSALWIITALQLTQVGCCTRCIVIQIHGDLCDLLQTSRPPTFPCLPRPLPTNILQWLTVCCTVLFPSIPLPFRLTSCQARWPLPRYVSWRPLNPEDIYVLQLNPMMRRQIAALHPLLFGLQSPNSCFLSSEK